MFLLRFLSLGKWASLILWLGLLSPCTSQTIPMQIWGYQAWWMGDDWKSQNQQVLDRSIFFQLEVAPSGALAQRHGWPGQWTEWQARLQHLGQPLELGVTLSEPNVFGAVFGSTEATRLLLNELSALAASNGVAGLHLDVEVQARQVSKTAITRFRQFVRALEARLRQLTPRRQLTVFLPSGNYADIYDSATLARIDWVVLQGYDAHFLDSPQAGPLAPLAGADTVTWEKMRQLADRLKLPRRRLIMGFPLYGYEWTVSTCQPRGQHQGVGGLTTLLPLDGVQIPQLRASIQSQVALHGAQVEPVTNSLYYLFDNGDGGCTVGWFEDSWSLRVKADWLSRNGFAGLAFFPLGYDRGILMNLLRDHWRRP